MCFLQSIVEGMSVRLYFEVCAFRSQAAVSFGASATSRWLLAPVFGHGFRRAWYRWIANFNALPTVCVLQLPVTGCRVQFYRLMVITKHKLVPFWCKGLFGTRGMGSSSSQWIYDTSQRVFVVLQASPKLFGLNARMEEERWSRACGAWGPFEGMVGIH